LAHRPASGDGAKPERRRLVGPGRFFYGPMATYANLEKNDATHLNYLVVGPWNHGGWAHGPGNWLGQIPFAGNTGEYFERRWRPRGLPTGSMTKANCP